MTIFKEKNIAVCMEAMDRARGAQKVHHTQSQKQQEPPHFAQPPDMAILIY